jgi:hypothetical protein
MMEQNKKRLFFGAEIHAPWPTSWPQGRLIEERYRHSTLVFLGSTYEERLPNIPLPQFQIGPCGWFDSVIFLPEKEPHVVAWHARWQDTALATYQETLIDWLHHSKEPWLSHVTVSRAPFAAEKWKESFSPLPCFAGSIHLYESLGNSVYHILWSHPITPPFEEIEHTADMAFRVVGQNLQNLYVNAFTAIAFKCPDLVTHWQPQEIQSLDEIVMALNRAVSATDQTVGCSFKAVSFHGEIRSVKDILEWEMIIDV